MMIKVALVLACLVAVFAEDAPAVYSSDLTTAENGYGHRYYGHGYGYPHYGHGYRRYGRSVDDMDTQEYRLGGYYGGYRGYGGYGGYRGHYGGYSGYGHGYGYGYYG